VPNDLALVYRLAFVQAYCTGALGLRLSNALDVLVGN
jgi:hypothetical protein